MKRLTQDKFIFKCKEKHGDKYDYSLVEYINISKKIQIIRIPYTQILNVNEILKNNLKN
jgi:hypothetical protein